MNRLIKEQLSHKRPLFELSRNASAVIKLMRDDHLLPPTLPPKKATLTVLELKTKQSPDFIQWNITTFFYKI